MAVGVAGVQIITVAVGVAGVQITTVAVGVAGVQIITVAVGVAGVQITTVAVLMLQVCRSLLWLYWCCRCTDHYCDHRLCWCCRCANHYSGCVGVAGVRSLLWLCWCFRCADHCCGCVGVAGVQITSGAQSPDPDGYTAEWKAPKLLAKKVSEFRLVYKKVRPQSSSCFVS